MFNGRSRRLGIARWVGACVAVCAVLVSCGDDDESASVTDGDAADVTTADDAADVTTAGDAEASETAAAVESAAVDTPAVAPATAPGSSVGDDGAADTAAAAADATAATTAQPRRPLQPRRVPTHLRRRRRRGVELRGRC